MIISWNVDRIVNELSKCYYAATDSRQDGFTTWRCKQDLYRVKFELERMLDNCATYADEEQWLQEQKDEQEKRKIWQQLNSVSGLR